ncbi:MAG: GldG family protein [Puniceicoccaceae bacterium]
MSQPDFRRTRRIRSFHLFLQSIMAVTFVFGLNYLASKYYLRTDLTKSLLYSLSPETKGYLRNLDGNIRIFVTIPEDPEVKELRMMREDVRSLLREMQYIVDQEATNGSLTVEFIDLYRERNRAREIEAAYNISRPNSIIVVSDEFSREITPEMLYNFSDGRLTEFRGESSFLSAILDVVYGRKGKLYLVVGQGEMRYDNVDQARGLSQAYDYLRQSGVLIDQLDLTRSERIPEDARAILIASPTASYRSREVQLIRDYVNRGGTVLAFLDPATRSGLEPFLLEWGIQLPDMVVLDPGPDYESSSGGLILRQFSSHPITKVLIDLQITLLMGLPRPVVPVLSEEVRSAGIELRTLVQSSADSFGESSYRDGTPPMLNPDVDLIGPIPVAVAAERSLSNLAGVALASDEAARILVVGNSDLIANRGFRAAGNAVFLRNAVNWAIERRELLELPPRKVREYYLVISKENLLSIAISFAIIPGILLVTTILAQLGRR